MTVGDVLETRSPALWCPRCPHELDLTTEAGRSVARCNRCGWRGEASVLFYDRIPSGPEEVLWHSSVTRRELRSFPTTG